MRGGGSGLLLPPRCSPARSGEPSATTPRSRASCSFSVLFLRPACRSWCAEALRILHERPLWWLGRVRGCFLHARGSRKAAQAVRPAEDCDSASQGEGPGNPIDVACLSSFLIIEIVILIEDVVARVHENLHALRLDRIGRVIII